MKIPLILLLLVALGTSINIYADNVPPSNTSKIIADGNEVKLLDRETLLDTAILDKTINNNVSKNKPVTKNQEAPIFKEMVVTDESKKNSHFTSPSTRITRSHIEKQNDQTTERSVLII